MRIPLDLTKVPLEDGVPVDSMFDGLKVHMRNVLDYMDIDLSVENDGIGPNEYMGMPGFDRGVNTLVVEGTVTVGVTPGPVSLTAIRTLLEESLGDTRDVSEQGVTETVRLRLREGHETEGETLLFYLDVVPV